MSDYAKQSQNHRQFVFYNPSILVDRDLELKLVEAIFPNRNPPDYIPVYKFRMRQVGTDKRLGRINFRVANTKDIVLYAGHFGYNVVEEHRGNRYAARSCRLLFPLAIKHRINPLWITCNPENLASRRTCELAGGKLIEVVDLPPNNDQYKDGDRQKCRYRFDLSSSN